MQSASARGERRLRILFLALALCSPALPGASQASDEIVYLCVDERTDNARVVRGPHACRRGERVVSKKAGSAQAGPEDDGTLGSGPIPADIALGEACSSDASCSSRLCVDGVCCEGTCGSPCHACDLPGLEGSCAPIPGGTDPDQECGPISCAAFYAGFVGDTCHRRADVDAACSGSGSCQTPADACPLAAVGEAALVCEGPCQSPVAGTCVGATPGACSQVRGARGCPR